LNQIRDIIKVYRRQVEQLAAMRPKQRLQKREEICVRGGPGGRDPGAGGRAAPPPA
jgi:hypothetical protein